MKFLVLSLFAYLQLTNAKLTCHIYNKGTTCSDGKIKQGEPIIIAKKQTNLTLENITGTIDVKTLSLLPEMEELTIINSEISHIENEALCSAPKLQRLYITDNKIFPKLSKDLLSNCGNIKIIGTSSVEIEPNAFKDMPNLEKIRMYNQTIDHFTKDYLEGLNNLKEFVFIESQVEKIEPSVFCLSPKMEKLIFETNTIFPNLTNDLLKDCSNIKILNIVNAKDNKIIKIDENMLNGLNKLVELIILYVDIENIGTNFVGLTALEGIGLVGTNTASIDENAFKDLKSLKSLYIVDSKLTVIKPNTFKNLRSLLYLELPRNKLTSIDNIKDLPKVTKLDVTYNLISTVDVEKLMVNLPSLEFLDIYRNPMSCEYKIELSKKLKEVGNINSRTGYAYC